MKIKEWNEEVSYTFNLIAYAESLPASVQSILNELAFLCEYAYILHEKDIEADGSLKKPHYHIYLKFTKRIRYRSIAKKFGIAPNNALIQSCRNKILSIRYFVHLDDPEKYQYNTDELITANIDRDSLLTLSYSSDEEKEKNDFYTIIDYIADNDVNYWSLIHFVLANNLIGTYRRCYSMFKDLLNEKKERV